VKTYRMNATMGGVLYFMGTVFGVVGGLVGGEVLSTLITGAPLEGGNILTLLANNVSQLTSGAFFTLLMGISLSAMTLFLYPVFRKDSEELAAGMLLFRGALEGVAYFVQVLGLLIMVAIGSESATAGADLPALQSVANALYRAMGVFGHTGTILFITGAVCLYISFYRTRLIPRWLTLWGLLGVVPYLVNALLHFFHLETGIGVYLEIPLAIQELVMGAWLVIAGFNKDAAKELDKVD
jgi:hypothetical protein